MDERIEIFDIKRRDLPELTRLARDYFAELEVCDEGLRKAEGWDEDYFEMLRLGLMAVPFFMRGARADGEMLGFIMFTFRVERMWTLATRGYISNLYVVPQHRGRGIGRRLVTDAVERLKKAGAQSVEMEVYPTNEKGRKFWEKMGFAPFKLRNRILFPD